MTPEKEEAYKLKIEKAIKVKSQHFEKWQNYCY